MHRSRLLLSTALVALLAGAFAVAQPQAPAKSNGPEKKALRKPDIFYVPTPTAVVEEMLKMADVKKTDVVYDLGCGDGRIVIAAAKKYGARGVGIDIDPDRIKEAEENARAAGVSESVKFRLEDLFEADIHEATVVTLYLLESLNVKLLPKLQAQLKPGTRIVSHAFGMGDWKAEKSAEVEGRMVYLWTVPQKSAK